MNIQVLAICLLMYQGAMSIKVLESVHKLGERRFLNGARIKEPSAPVNLTDMTICMRWNLKTLAGSGGRLSTITIGREYDYNYYARNSKEFIPEWLWLATWAGDMGFLGLGSPRQRGYFRTWILFDEDRHGERQLFATNRWTHFCVSYRKRDGLIIIMRNGKEIGGSPSGQPDPEMTKVTFPDDIISLINIGKCPYDSGGSCSTPEAEYADVNLWGRALTRQELVDWTTCRSMDKGDKLNWDNATFNLFNMTEKEMPMDAICKPIRPGHTIFPSKRKFHEIVSICKQFKGSMSVIKNRKTELELTKQFAEHEDTCWSSGGNWAFWNGWWDGTSEGTFTSVVTNETLGDYQPWAVGEPNGHTRENCAVSWPQEKQWNDANCGASICAFCNLQQAPTFTLRETVRVIATGLCSTSKLDIRYSWTGKAVNGFFQLRGYTHSSMTFNQDEKEWRIQRDGNPDTYLSIKHRNYPFGLLEWEAHNDNACGNATVRFLSMSACLLGEFNCQNGHCIDMDKRCDGVTDCEDTSDEIDCVVFEKSPSYLKNMPPESSNSQSNATVVDLEAEILAVLNISEVASLISMQIEIHLSWFDKRLTMIDLNQKPFLNSLSLERRQEIWLPEVIFYNTEVKSETLNDEKAFAVVIREGEYRRRSVESLQNTYEYTGNQNPIKLSRVYTAKFICEYDMRMYPFDKQECSAIFTMKGKFDEFVKLRGKNSSYLGPIDLPQYYVTGTEIVKTTVPPNINAVQIKIFFGRRVLSIMLSSYVPTFLICLVTFCTNFFHPYYFEAIVTVNLTSMLVLTTLFIGIMDSLPQTSYIKMIDIWNLFCLTVPFLAVTLQTFLEYHSEENPAENVVVNNHGHVKLVRNSKQNHGKPETNRIDVIGTAGEGINKVSNMKSMTASNKVLSATVRTAQRLVKWGLPIYFFGFSVIYSIVGVTN